MRQKGTLKIVIKQVVIVGSGPAGLTSAIYLSRSGLKPYIATGDNPGGQLINIDTIENFPGFQSISGADLTSNMMKQVESSASEIIFESVQSINKIDQEIFQILLSNESKILTKAVLIATGAKHKHLCVQGENEFINKGVSWCATCDGPMYKGKKVAVIGGGNSALTEALFLSNFSEKVYLIHRKDSFRADKVIQSRVFSNSKINIIWNSVVTEIIGKESVSGVVVNGIDTLNVEGVFIAIGTHPVSDFVKDIVDLDEEGYIKVEDAMTSCSGIFAAGDVVSGSLKQAVYAAGQGALVAHMVEKYLGVR
jgi:thioredoxin reductase (NADPH)